MTCKLNGIERGVRGHAQVERLEAERQHWQEMYQEAVAAAAGSRGGGKAPASPAQLPLSRSASRLLGSAGHLPGRAGQARSPVSSSGVVVAADEDDDDDLAEEGTPPGDLAELDDLIRCARPKSSLYRIVSQACTSAGLWCPPQSI